MTVVVGVDGSPPSRTELRLAAQEARCRQVPLIAVSAYEPPLGKPAGGWSGGTVTLDGGPLTSTGYRRYRDWQEQWLALPRQVTPAVIGADGTVRVGADLLRCLAAIMVAVGALPGRERVVQPGPVG
jgi:hypothetical protein